MNLSIFALVFGYSIVVCVKKRIFIRFYINKFLYILIFIAIYSIPLKIILDEVPTQYITEMMLFKKWVTPFLLFFVVFNVINDEESCNNILLGLIALLFFTIVASLVVAYGKIQIGVIELGRGGRTAGLAEPNQYAAYLVLFIPLILSSVIFAKNRFRLIISLVLFIVTLVALVVSGSRGGLLSFVASMSVYLWLLKRVRYYGFAKMILFVTITVILLFSAYLLSPQQVTSTLEQKIVPDSSTDFETYTSGRSWVLKKGVALFLERPFFGHGQDSFTYLMERRFGRRINSHNDYMSYMVEYGIVGLAAFIAIFVRLIYGIWRSCKTTSNVGRRTLYISYLAGLSGYLVAMLGVNIIVPVSILWIYTAIVCKYSYLEHINVRNQQHFA